MVACGGGAGEGADGGGGGDAAVGGDGAAPGTRRTVGYYTSWSMYDRDFQVEDMRADLLTHVNYAFANVTDGRCVLGDDYADRMNFAGLRTLKGANAHLQTLLSVGGYTWSAGFAAPASSAEGRATFATSCVDLMLEHGFDGLDIDWEYPGGGGEAAGTPADTANFTLLLAALRAELDARGPGHPLTVAVGAGAGLRAHYDVPGIVASVDWINVMTYDFHGPWDATTGFNAPMDEVTAAVQGWLDAGVSRDRLVVGVPFYGHVFGGVGATNDGLGQATTGAGPGTWAAGTVDYYDVAANYTTRLERHWSETAQVPWLYDAAAGTMISYDDAESLAAKAALIDAQGLGGVMIWDLSSDDAGHSLLLAIQ